MLTSNITLKDFDRGVVVVVAKYVVLSIATAVLWVKSLFKWKEVRGEWLN